MTGHEPDPETGAPARPRSGRTPEPPGFQCRVLRYPDAALLELTWPDGGELYFVVSGARSIGIMAFDHADETHREPRIHVVPKPYQWSIDVPDDELLLLVWLTLGEQR
ncbi:MAG: hypothetical protein AB1679_00845 [Actinomycetota bacterium]